jgi:hypothetical protein
MPPGVAGVWPGRDVQIECISELYITAGGAPERPIVAFSARIERPYTYYRPHAEHAWDAQVSSSLTLEEIYRQGCRVDRMEQIPAHR